ncbi:MAG: hypothetical protein IJ600_11085 [Lachnospiraceae bacterium]|nr:hypothetical protein [Lachnospiraceae bacterium]
MSKGLIVFLIILAVIIILLVVLYFLGRKMQKRQDEQKAMMEANKQSVSLLVIDKKRIKIKDAKLPADVMAQLPKLSKNIKAPMVKVKIGPQIMTMFCDEQIFDLVPVKKEIRAEISGMYLVGVKGVHGTKLQKDVKKKSKFKQWVEKMQEKAGAKSIK